MGVSAGVSHVRCDVADLECNSGAIADRGPVSCFLCYSSVAQGNLRYLAVFLRLGVTNVQAAEVVVLFRTMGCVFWRYTHVGSSLLCSKTRHKELRIKHCARIVASGCKAKVAVLVR